MQYTTLGKTGLTVSRLGFGCMRFPMKTDKEVDRDLAIPMLRRAVELGVTYFDTAVGYCAGDSQRVLGEAMEGLRNKIVLSTKNHHYDKQDKDGWWKNLNDSLERLRTDYIDIYNFHGMNFERYETAVSGEAGLYLEALKAKEQGMIGHICHSFHGSLESLKRCIDTGLFDSVTVQYNLLDQRLEEGIAYAAEHNQGVVIMGPVGGGRLGYPSGKAHEIAGEVKSTPELALRFVLSNENVNVALSGMSTMEQLEENVETVSNLDELTAADHKKIEAAIEERKKLAGLYCTGCNYCMPCPDAVDIPANFEILNLDRVFGLSDHARSRYAALGGKAALCRQCGKCVELCPQELEIPKRLGEAVALLDERSGSVAGWGELRKGSMTSDGLLSVDLRYNIKNFTDETYPSVDVELRSHREEEIAPYEFEVKNLEGYGRRHKKLQIRTVPPMESLSIDSIITFNGSHTVEHLSYVVTSAHRRTSASTNGSSLDRPDAPTVHVPSPIHPAHSSKQPLGPHAYDFAVRYDDRHLYVWADVEDDMQRLADSQPVGRLRVDHFRFFVDAREPYKIGLGGYGEGVLFVTIFPPSDESASPFVTVSNDAEVQIEMKLTDFGYQFECAIPWNALSENPEIRKTTDRSDGQTDSGERSIPDIVGFDAALVSHDSEGNRTLRLSWTGRDNQERDTAAFGKILLV